MKLHLSFILLITLASCSNQKGDNTLSYLPVSDSLSVEIGSPTLMAISGDKLFVNHSYADGYNIDVIDITNDSIIYSFAKKGQGANEFLQITSLDVFEEGGKSYLELFDNFQRKLTVYNIDALNAYKGNCAPAYEKKVTNESRYLELYKARDGYLATGRTEKKYTLFSEDMSVKTQCGEYQTSEKREDDYMILSKANYGRSYLSTDRTSVANVVFMSGKLTVYDIAGTEIKSRWEYVASDFRYEADGSTVKQLSLTGYLAAGFKGDSIIGLYSGEEKTDGTNYGNEFHVFDAKGSLLHKYKTDTHLYNFCISPETGILYAISYKSDPKILVYRF